MQNELYLYNTLTRKKELFKPLHPPFVGMYVCGPTVYNEVHLGNLRTFTSFDVIFRYLKHLDYKVRYVRNITDAGHLEDDSDEDKISKRAALERLEPMEIVQKYTVSFHEIMRIFNNLPPSIEPTATGHILEQQEMTMQILKNGWAYEVNGTVYFDVEKYAKHYDYTALTGRNLEELLNNTRELDGQDEKRGRLDFALWIKAKPQHLMKWNSPWGKGFPGWHIECSAMSTKYLGEEFDIHGGGMDLAPTHHTNEIAQNIAYCGKSPARFWLHTNMLTLNGKKMSKSLGNVVLPLELISGTNPLIPKGFSPAVLRFFMMQTHYRSTLDITLDALNAAEKGYQRLVESFQLLPNIKPSSHSSINVKELEKKCYDAMNDDFNTAVLIAELFEISKIIYKANDGQFQLTAEDIKELQKLVSTFFYDILGIPKEDNNNDKVFSKLQSVMDILLEIRLEAKKNKNYTLSDSIRQKLEAVGIIIKDTPEGTRWSLK
ncbi:MAG TPA: cysteine--tRNA ligase [Bacteroidia bacterium]|nr:cysteine--tRNA ligase [Bacteroidia bacterium]